MIGTVRVQRILARLALALALATGFVSDASLTAAESQEPVRETFVGHAVGTVGTGRTGAVTVTITRWTTDEERERLAALLVGDRAEKLAETFVDQEETGFVQIQGRPGYRLRYAWELRRGGRRRILLVADQRIRFRQARDGTRVPNSAVSVVELLVDQSGAGEGRIDVVTALDFDTRSRIVGIDAFAPLGVQLLEVTKIE